MRPILLILALLICGCGRVTVPIPELEPGGFPKVNKEWSSGLDALFLYSYAFCIVIIAACLAVLVWVPLPSLRKWALIGLTFAGCLIGMGITFAIVKPFIPWIVLSGVAVGVAIGVWYIVANFHVLRQLIHKDVDGAELSASAQNMVAICQNLPTKIKP